MPNSNNNPRVDSEGVYIDKRTQHITIESAEGAATKKTLEVFRSICDISKNDGNVETEEVKRLISLYCQLNENIGKESRATHAQIHENKAKAEERQLKTFTEKAKVIGSLIDSTLTKVANLKMAERQMRTAKPVAAKPIPPINKDNGVGCAAK
jgi:hypothetical protein